MNRISNLLLFSFLILGVRMQATVRYVKPIASGSGIGTTWSNASSNLHAMIAGANPGDQIWVAVGTYFPSSDVIGNNNPGDPRTKTFKMRNDITIYGGFTGTETSLSQRNLSINQTILSGDIGIQNNNSDNCYSVITNLEGINNTAVLDGFVITRGYGNYGGGINNNGGMNISCSPTFINCIITQNAGTFGAGVANSGLGNPTFTNCLFYQNQSILNGSSSSGGAFYCQGNVSATLTNCTFANNYSSGRGGAIYSYTFFGIPIIALNNCIFWGNSAGVSGNEIYLDGTSIGISNTLLPGGISGITTSSSPYNNINNSGNILSNNPLFVDASNSNFRLLASSPAINAGSNALIPSGIATDIEGNTRVNAGTVDMGVYEASCQITLPPLTTTNNALHFDGINDYVMLSSCSNGNIFPGGDALTIEYWFKGSHLQSPVRFQPGSTDYIAAGWTGNVVSNIPKHILSNDGGTNGINVANSTAAIYNNNWHHIAMTWQKNQKFTSYLDGVQIEQRNAGSTPLPSFNTACYLGSLSGLGEFLNGSLDEVRVWTTARTQSQIQNGMNCALTDNSGLLMYFKFNHAIANGNNSAASINNTVVGNYASTIDVYGGLNNFARNGTNSNWIIGKPGLVSAHKYYVDSSITASGDGTSWASAFKTLQEALDIAQTCVDTIWVAKGTYYPSTDLNGYSNPTSIFNTFSMLNHVAILGGFSGTETLFSQRNLNNNRSILSGDIGILGIKTDNCIRIITNNGLDSSAVLDGFTIRDAYHPTTYSTDQGGGMRNDNASPTIMNCVFTENAIASWGASIACFASSPKIINCVFYNNSSGNGGDIYLHPDVYYPYTPSIATITNCTFYSNLPINWFIATNFPGGIANVRNCIFGETAGFFSNQGGEINITYSIANGYPGTGNINQNPLFINAAAGNFKLQSNSPAFNAGSNAVVPPSATTDITGAPRIQMGTVDMGAYEASLSLKLFIQGYYTGSNTMTPTLMNEGIGNSTVNVDTILIQLRSASAPSYSVVASTKTVLKTNGTALAYFADVVPNGNYYIVIKHRNAVETWSANPINLSTISTYDFSTAANKAFDSNQIQVGLGVWAMYSGNLNTDENVDLLDASTLETDINQFQFGYFATDLNGDGNVDLLDVPVLEDNINNFVFAMHP